MVERGGRGCITFFNILGCIFFRFDVCRCFNQGEKDEAGLVKLNKAIPLSDNKEEVSPLKAAESNLYIPSNGPMNDV